MIKERFVIGLAPLLLMLAGCGQESEPVQPQARPAEQASESPDWDAFVADWTERYFEFNPPAAVTAGLHEFDGQLPDFSEQGVAAAVAWLRDSRERAGEFPAAALDEDEQFERDYLLAYSDGLLFTFVSSNFLHTNPVFYARFASPSTYVTLEYAPLDESWPEAKQQGYLPGKAELLFISVHEVWPGHFLHFLHANRAESKFGQLFQTYTFTEGWAHYTEELMWDAGLHDGDPRTHIGQLTNALLRNVRYLSAIGLHTGGMSVEESRRMFEESAFQDAGNAMQQARRGTYDAGYLNYTLGKLMIMKLRHDWTAERGGRDAWREFHDRFLSYGGPPVPLVRREMLGEGYAGDRHLLPVRDEQAPAGP